MSGEEPGESRRPEQSERGEHGGGVRAAAG